MEHHRPGRHLGIKTWQNLVSTQPFRGTMSIKMFGNPQQLKKHAEQELDNAVDKFAVKVVKNNEPVGHLPPEYSRILGYFITHGRKIWEKVTGHRCHCKYLCGGMEIPCRLVSSCLSKVKLIAGKNLGEQDSPINTRRHKWHLQQPPLMKTSMNNSNMLSDSFVFISCLFLSLSPHP